MGNAKKNRTTNAGLHGSIRNLFSKPLRDRFCKACGRPYVDPNEPLPVRRFNLGNAEVQVFESAAFGRLKRELKVHCWNRYRDQWCSQSFFSEHDFQHLAAVIGQALRFMNEQDRPKDRSRSMKRFSGFEEVFTAAIHRESRHRFQGMSPEADTRQHVTTEDYAKQQAKP